MVEFLSYHRMIDIEDPMCNPFNSDEVTAYKAHNNKVLATSPCLTFNSVTQCDTCAAEFSGLKCTD